jgi:hypothetical protein
MIIEEKEEWDWAIARESPCLLLTLSKKNFLVSKDQFLIEINFDKNPKK